MPAPSSLPDARPADKGPLVPWDTCLAAFSGGGLEGTRHLQLAGRGRTSRGRALPHAGALCGGYSGFLLHGQPETNPAMVGRAPGTRGWQSPDECADGPRRLRSAHQGSSCPWDRGAQGGRTPTGTGKGSSWRLLCPGEGRHNPWGQALLSPHAASSTFQGPSRWQSYSSCHLSPPPCPPEAPGPNSPLFLLPPRALSCHLRGP